MKRVLTLTVLLLATHANTQTQDASINKPRTYLPLPDNLDAREPTGRDLQWISNIEVREGNRSRSFTGLLFEGDDPREVAAAMCTQHKINRCKYVEDHVIGAEAVAVQRGPLVLAKEVHVHFLNETKTRVLKVHRKDTVQTIRDWCAEMLVNASEVCSGSVPGAISTLATPLPMPFVVCTSREDASAHTDCWSGGCNPPHEYKVTIRCKPLGRIQRTEISKSRTTASLRLSLPIAPYRILSCTPSISCTV